jgi:hypothetical protein
MTMMRAIAAAGSLALLLIRMLIIGYCFGIRSERRLCEEVHLNLAYRRLFLCRQWISIFTFLTRCPRMPLSLRLEEHLEVCGGVEVTTPRRLLTH